MFSNGDAVDGRVPSVRCSNTQSQPNQKQNDNLIVSQWPESMTFQTQRLISRLESDRLITLQNE